MEGSRTPWPILALVGLVAVLVSAYTISHIQRGSTPPEVQYMVQTPQPLPFDLSASARPRYRGGPPGERAPDNAEYPVGTGPSDELLPGHWMAYPPGRDCKWVIESPPAPGVTTVMVTQPDGRPELLTSHWIAGSTETHWTPGTAIYIQLDAGVRFQTVGCGTWLRTDPRPTPSPRVR